LRSVAVLAGREGVENICIGILVILAVTGEVLEHLQEPGAVLTKSENETRHRMAASHGTSRQLWQACHALLAGGSDLPRQFLHVCITWISLKVLRNGGVMYYFQYVCELALNAVQ
jgi:hypothetical protein